MTKVRKVKKRKRFQVNVNRKRLRNKLNKLPTIQCKEIKDAWEVKKSIEGNLRDMGLVTNPNKIFKIPNSAKEALETEITATENFTEESFIVEKPPSKGHVAEILEKEAKAPRERMFKLPQSQVQFITYMMDKYGDDYKAMTRDKKNYYQLTWRQMRAKINTFKNIPLQYANYLVEKGEIVLDNPVSLAETRKQNALDNFQKHCVSKKPKKVKVASVWEEESVEPIEEANEDSSDNRTLNLFVDNDSDSETKTSSKKEKGTVNKASNGILQTKSIKNKTESGASDLKEDKTSKRKTPDEKKSSKKIKRLEKAASSDSECEDELDGEESNSGFVNLSDLSSEELSDDDILDDGEFVTDSEDKSD